MPLYLVGGPVRDLLLDRPAKDLDLVVEGDAASLAFEVAKELAGEVTSYRQFGTATVKVDQMRLDLATARRETYPRPGALPQVKPSTIDEDLKRRDFTINAMAIGLSEPGLGRLLDPTSGLKDLELGQIRALHPQSFQDDATRMLRAVRYEQRLSFHLEPETQDWLLQDLEEGMLATVSADRLRREVDFMLKEEWPATVLMRAGQLEILRKLYQPLRDASWLRSLDQQGKKEEPLFYLAALAYPLRPQEGEALIARLNMLKRWATTVRDIIYLKEIEQPLAAQDLSASSLCRLLNGRSHASTKALACLTPRTLVRDRSAQYLDHLRYVKPMLRGRDLLALGVPQGPKVGQILQELKDARLEGRVTTRKEETDLARKYLVVTED